MSTIVSVSYSTVRTLPVCHDTIRTIDHAYIAESNAEAAWRKDNGPMFAGPYCYPMTYVYGLSTDRSPSNPGDLPWSYSSHRHTRTWTLTGIPRAVGGLLLVESLALPHWSRPRWRDAVKGVRDHECTVSPRVYVSPAVIHGMPLRFDTAVSYQGIRNVLPGKQIARRTQNQC